MVLSFPKFSMLIEISWLCSVCILGQNCIFWTSAHMWEWYGCNVKLSKQSWSHFKCIIFLPMFLIHCLLYTDKKVSSYGYLSSFLLRKEHQIYCAASVSTWNIWILYILDFKQTNKHDIFNNNSHFRYSGNRSFRNMDHRIIFLPLVTLGNVLVKMFLVSKPTFYLQVWWMFSFHWQMHKSTTL